MNKLCSIKFLPMLLALLLLSAAALPGTEANAMATSLDPDAVCSLTVKTPNDMELLKQAKFTVKLYRFASVDEQVHYSLLDGYSSVTTEPDSIKPNVTEQLKKLSEEVLAAVEGNADLPCEELPVTNGEGKKENLAAGLWLLVPEKAYTDDKIFTMEPFVIALPNGETDPETQVEDWNYNVTVFMKAAVEDRTGKVIIKKTFEDYNETFTGADAVFTVNVTKQRENENEVVFNNLVSMHFTAPGTEQYELTGLPVGSEVSVSEVYSGGAYRLVSSSVNYPEENPYTVKPYDEEKDDENPAPLTFSFVNEYDESLKKCVAVINHYELKENGYSGQQAAESPAYQPQKQKEADK